MTQGTPTIAELKAQARRLRATMQESGAPMAHATALETVARQHGHRDWNTARAAAAWDNPARWQIGQHVRGRYLSHPFTGRIKSASEGTGGFWRLTLAFDAPVDVVTSRHFSNWRKQVSCTVNAQGVTVDKTSDGTPHLSLFAA
ncbi:glyoxalase superfamily protein [Alisedimentitalea sp. MJ-SS2]|uniref:glyoxalase superfamily protein n=1 Tax=Aliisedimentitalea sp. MJ-SS2 TaxID=3049795 RepID=UPI002914276E|nr:glyoxalase superfamily protein [Alisedimentitalea sp. MJ-SS2]MDU8926496.1 glyoxalase superfamily protein [Alisedimentitalea sp. MJ-SS2]